MTLLFVGFAAPIVFGVVYNSARIALAERARELATMRMLGFFRMEVSYILLGELALLTAIAVPPGCLGRLSAGLEADRGAVERDVPPAAVRDQGELRLRVFWLSALTVLVSGLAVAWRVFRFDLIGILKIRE